MKLTSPLSFSEALAKGNPLSLFALLLLWVLTLYHYPALPETIPVHYNAAGEADGFGNKWVILSLPAIATTIFIGLSLAIRRIRNNGLSDGTANEKDAALLGYASGLISYLNLVSMLIFLAIACQTIMLAHGQSDGLGAWFLPIVLVMVFIPLGWYVVRMVKVQRD